jgi:hypothetical protein
LAALAFVGYGNLAEFCHVNVAGTPGVGQEVRYLIPGIVDMGCWKNQALTLAAAPAIPLRKIIDLCTRQTGHSLDIALSVWASDIRDLYGDSAA